ncbi:hypothetical protein H6P87_00921 [Rickettsia tillamookensis]|uniref:Uncharacterized protein n=1 Tax=Rickettsia tillamookensis TaxID=2761623 RepID=A0A9E6MHU1_9RICK|nr:type II toxin-antitoxin system RelE/ParE family toxin [Rickettsia tillamookensis]QQV75365.1 hypothetical protein H6P87_00921 [Rickettsia tillamookensis]
MQQKRIKLPVKIYLQMSSKKAIYQYLIKNVSISPRNHGLQLKSVGIIKLWRYRVRDYRLICQIKDHEVTVLVIKIGKRDAVYKNLD